MQAFEDAGIELDVIARGIGAGAVSYAVARHQPCRPPGIGTWRPAPV
jgi:hypothetical protein